jgi:hypothetical protein
LLHRQVGWKRSAGDHSYRVCAPQLWKALPKHIGACDDFNVFKSMIKTVLFEEAFMSLLAGCICVLLLCKAPLANLILRGAIQILLLLAFKA